MSFAVRKFTFNAITAGSTQTVSPPNNPHLGAAKAVLFFGVAINNDGSAQAHNRYFMGAACPDGTNGCTTVAADDNVATMIGGGRTEVNAALKIDLQATTPTLDAVATVTTWNADGSIVVTWSDLPSLAFRIQGLLFYGSDIGNATVRQVTCPATAGTHSHTGMSFRPTFVFRPTSAQTSFGVRTNGSHHSWCMFTESQSVAGGFATSEAADAANSIAQREGRSFYAPAIAGTLLWDAYLVSMNADGWTEQFVTSAGSSNTWALCLGGPFRVALGTDTKPTSASAKTTTVRGAPDMTQAPIFEDTFSYSDGDLDTVSGGVWGNPYFAAQQDIRVVSGKAMKATTGTWSDAYTTDNTFGDGDYVFKGLTVQRSLGFICAAHDAEGGTDGYGIDCNPGSSIRLVRVDNDVTTALATATINTWTAGDSFVIRKDGSRLSIWHFDAATSKLRCIAEPVTDTTYTSGRIAIETNSATAEFDAVAVYPLPAGFQVAGALLYSWGQVASTTVDTGNAENGKLSVGAFDDVGNEGSVWFGHDDGAATSEANMRLDLTKALQFTSDFTGTVDSECDASPVDGGFKLDWTTADGTASQFAFAAFAPAVSFTIRTIGVAPTPRAPGGMRRPIGEAFYIPAEPAEVGGTTFFQTLTATATGSASLVKQANIIRTATSTAAASFIKQANIIRSASSTATASIIKQARTTLSAASTGAASLIKQARITLSATGTGSASLTVIRVALLTLSATATGTATLIKQANIIRSATATGTASLIKQARITLSTSSTGTATLSAVKVLLLTLSATATGTATLTKQAGKLLTVTATGTATLTKVAGKLLTAGATGTATIIKQARKTLSATGTGTATINTLRSLVLSATSTATATITKRVSTTLSATGTGTATLTKVAAKTLSAASTGSATLARTVGKVLTATATGSAAIVRLVRKTLSVVVTADTTILLDGQEAFAPYGRFIQGLFGSGPGRGAGGSAGAGGGRGAGGSFGAGGGRGAGGSVNPGGGRGAGGSFGSGSDRGPGGPFT